MSAACGWRCGDETPGHKHYTVLCYEGGKLLGGLTPQGGANRLKVHRAILGRERAERIAEEINAAGEFAAKVAPF